MKRTQGRHEDTKGDTECNGNEAEDEEDASLNRCSIVTSKVVCADDDEDDMMTMVDSETSQQQQQRQQNQRQRRYRQPSQKVVENNIEEEEERSRVSIETSNNERRSIPKHQPTRVKISQTIVVETK